MPKIPPSAATPSPMYTHCSLVSMGRTVRRGAPIRNLLMAATVLLFAASCSAAHRGYSAGKVAALKCGEPQLATAAAIVARWAVEDALAGKVDWAQHERDAEGFGLGVGTCAYAESLRAWKAKPTVQALAVGAVPDDGSAGLERLRARLGGAEIVLADGAKL